MHDFAVTFDPATSLATLLLMISGALVLLMILGSAFFYGGLVRATSVVSISVLPLERIASLRPLRAVSVASASG